MTARYACSLCGETAETQQKLGGHMHARHPSHKSNRGSFSFLRTPTRARPRRIADLKRATDTWPGKP